MPDVLETAQATQWGVLQRTSSRFEAHVSPASDDHRLKKTVDGKLCEVSRTRPSNLLGVDRVSSTNEFSAEVSEMLLASMLHLGAQPATVKCAGSPIGILLSRP